NNTSPPRAGGGGGAQRGGGGLLPGNKLRKPPNHLRLQPRRPQQLRKRFAAARRIGGNEYAAGVAAEERLQRIRRRVILRRDRQVRRHVRRQRVGICVARMPFAAHFHPLAGVEALAQRLRRQVQLGRRQQRPLDVVAALLVTVGDLGEELLGAFAGAVADDRQDALAEVVEQGRGPVEEQRQVVLDAGRRDPGLQVLEQRTAAGVDVEALAQRVHGALRRGLVQ